MHIVHVMHKMHMIISAVARATLLGMYGQHIPFQVITTKESATQHQLKHIQPELTKSEKLQRSLQL